MRVKSAVFFAAAMASTVAFAAADVGWIGGSGNNWGTAVNWANAIGPVSTDVVSFASTGAASSPGTVTSVLNASRTLAGLSFNNLAGKFHTLDLAGQTLTLAGNLNVNLDQSSGTTATLRNGALVVNSAFANINVGRGVSGSANGIADLSGLTSLSTNLQSVEVGASTAGTATGLLKLSANNQITAQLIQCGAASNSGDTAGTITLGLSNTILCPEIDIGKDNSIGLINGVNGGVLNLGSTTQRTYLQIGNQSVASNTSYSGTLDLTGVNSNLFLNQVIVGFRSGGNGTGTAAGTWLGGIGGAVDIGQAGNTSNFYVGRSITASPATGTVDLSSMASFTANLNTLAIGTATAAGTARGILSLPTTNSINATSIVVGSSGGQSNTLTLGKTNTLITPSLTIGQYDSTGLVNIPAGGSLLLGSSAQPTSLVIASSNATANTSYSGKLDMSSANFSGYLSNLTVAQRDGGTAGSTTGTLLAGSGGSLTIGTSGNLAEFYVGRVLNSPGSATGIVDLSGLNSFSANLDQLSVGTSLSGSAQGTLSLAKANTINANSVVVGSSGNGNNQLTLGRTNTIITPQLTIAQDYSNAAVTLPAGGTLSLGTPSSRANLTIASATTNTNNTYAGSLDVSAGTMVGYLGNVVLGAKNSQPGTEQATFSIGNSNANIVDATTITIGGNQAVGTLNFGGGILYAGSITGGSGTPIFNWTGGQLAAGSIGTVAIPMNLKNLGTGILAPGSSSNPIGSTSIFGSYNQSSTATTAIDLAGDNYDQINISGTATLAGKLTVSLQNGFVPSLGQSFLIETYAAHSGTYSVVVPPALPAGLAVSLDYSTPTQLVLNFVAPASASYISTAAFGTFSTPANWNPQAVPGSATDAILANPGATSRTVTVNTSTSVNSLTVQGGSSTMELDVATGNQLVVAAGVNVAGNGTLKLASGSSMLANGPITGNGTTTIASGAQLTAGQISQNTVNLSGSAMVAQSNVRILNTINHLSINSGATFDLNNSDLDIQSGSLATAWNLIESGYNNGAWNGSGICSTTAAISSTHLTALGLLLNMNSLGNPLYGNGSPLGLFDGSSPAATDILVRYTYYGDANLDGKVDGSDYSLIDAGFLSASAGATGGSFTGWYSGDFNYDGTVNGSDYTLIDNAFNTQGAALADALAGSTSRLSGSSSIASVPEPVGFGLIVFAASQLRRRRRGTTIVVCHRTMPPV